MDCQALIEFTKKWAKYMWERAMGRGERCKCECCEKIKRK